MFQRFVCRGWEAPISSVPRYMLQIWSWYNKKSTQEVYYQVENRVKIHDFWLVFLTSCLKGELFNLNVKAISESPR